jgi:hypothetical protein
MRGLGFYRYDHISVGVWQGRTEREYFDVLKGRGQVLATLEMPGNALPQFGQFFESRTIILLTPSPATQLEAPEVEPACRRFLLRPFA